MRYWSSITAGVRGKKRARNRVKDYLIDNGLLSACVGKCAAQGGHREVNMRCAYEGVTCTDPKTFMNGWWP